MWEGLKAFEPTRMMMDPICQRPILYCNLVTGEIHYLFLHLRLSFCAIGGCDKVLLREAVRPIPGRVYMTMATMLPWDGLPDPGICIRLTCRALKKYRFPGSTQTAPDSVGLGWCQGVCI